MKKVFCILSIFTIVSPVFADPVLYPLNTEPGAAAANANVTTSVEPKYALAQSAGVTDSYTASAGYVKGAYNAALKAVNKVADMVATIPVDPENPANSSVRADIWVE